MTRNARAHQEGMERETWVSLPEVRVFVNKNPSRYPRPPAIRLPNATLEMHFGENSIHRCKTNAATTSAILHNAPSIHPTHRHVSSTVRHPRKWNSALARLTRFRFQEVGQ
jgi:hypothetical protein